jgi:hypothetical protein
MATGTIIPSPIFTGIDTNGDPVSGGKLYTYAAGTTTAQTTYSDVNLTSANANPLVLDSAGRGTLFISAGTSFKYVLKTSADVTIWTADNIGSVPKSTATLDVTVTAGEDLAALDCVYISQGDGSKTAGRAYKTDADNTYSSSTAISLGLAPAAIASGNTGSIRLGGSLGGYTGLTAGATQYVSATAGALTESAPTNVQIVGQATSTTEVMMAATISQLDASKITSGTLVVARGGTGAATHTSGSILLGNGTSAITSTAVPLVVAKGGTGATSLTSGRLLIGSGTSAVTDTGDATLNGDLTASGVGPHVFGGAVNDYTKLLVTGDFTSGGASARVTGFKVNGKLTAVTGDTTASEGAYFDTTLQTQASETIGRVTQVTISQPGITKGSGATVTNSASLYVAGASDQATNNYSIWVDEGDVIFDEDFICRGNVLVGSGSSASSELHVVAASGGSYVRIDSVSATADTGIELYKGGAREWELVNDHTGAASADALVFKPAGTTKFTFEQSGNLTITGALSKGSGSFRIPHPLPAKSETHQLVHSFIEGPQCDLIYRGAVTLVDGTATVNLDTNSGMSEGTWVLLCRDEQCFTSNETGWSSVRGSVTGNILTIECEDATSTDTISWMVVAERHDDHILETDWTDADGHVIVEPPLPEEEGDEEES